MPAAPPARRRALAALAAVALVAALPVAEAAAPKPPSGTYKSGEKVLLDVSPRSIDVAAFEFPCRDTTGRTSISQVAVKRRRGRYRFSIRTFGNATYRDDQPDENVRLTLTGRFSTSAKSAVGTLAVTAPYCGRMREIRWSAQR